jgi:hypothetical protein
MNDILEFIDELKDLKDINNDPFLDSKIKKLISKYDRQVTEYEESIEEQSKLFWQGTPFYNPHKEF